MEPILSSARYFWCFFLYLLFIHETRRRRCWYMKRPRLDQKTQIFCGDSQFHVFFVDDDETQRLAHVFFFFFFLLKIKREKKVTRLDEDKRPTVLHLIVFMLCEELI